MTKSCSIRTQLMRWLLFPLLGLIILSIFSSYRLASSFANSAFDDGLEETARAVAGQVEFDHGYWHLASPQLSRQIAAHHTREQMKFLIQSPDQKIIAGNPELGLPPQKFAYPGFRNAQVGGETFRISAIQIPVQNGALTVQVGETMAGRQELTNQILMNTIAHQLVLFLLAIACVWLGVSQGLLPLEKIRTEVAQRSANDLRALDESQTPDEIRPLIQTLNELMQQLGRYVGSQKRFVANAAHQLRTPLAGLRTQLELAQRQKNPDRTQHALNQMEIGLEQAIDLAERLLTLAKAEPDALSSEQFEPLNLVMLAEQSIDSFRSQATTKDIHLTFKRPENPVVIQGHALSIGELISNLLDNAIRYTPSGGKVTVRLQLQEGLAVLVVEDNGPGIPLPERERVLERFYRVPDQDQVGNGLGLSIVQEIAQTHGAKIMMKEGPGGKGTSLNIVFRLIS